MLATVLTIGTLTIAPLTIAPRAFAAPDTEAVPSIVRTADSGVIAVPAHIDLGAAPAGSIAESHLWLVNTSLQAVTIDSAKAGCGCTTMKFEPVSLAPGAAHPITFEIKVPDKPDTDKSVTLRFTPDWGDAITSTAHLSVSAADSEPSPSHEPVPTVALIPSIGDLGTMTIGETLHASAWLINTGDRPARVERIRAGCGCTTVVGWETVEVMPGAAMRVRLAVTPTKSSDGAKKIGLTAVVDDREPIAASLTVRVEPTTVAAK